MSTDPIFRLPGAFGTLLVRLRRERNWDVEALANASGLSAQRIQCLEAANYTPTLQDLFRLASGLGEPPVLLLAEVITEWRSDPTDIGLYRSRPSDLVRLHRLGYNRDPGEFRELAPIYDSLDLATQDARIINAKRATKGQKPLDVLTTYLRVGYIRFDPEPEKGDSP